jgi:hypothetical protein
LLSRKLSTLLPVMVITSLPDLLFTNPGLDAGTAVVGAFVGAAMRGLGQALVLNGAFQQMRGRPTSLIESVQFGSHRIMPVLGLVCGAWILIGLGTVLMIVPGLILATMLFVATPICVVERLGPIGLATMLFVATPICVVERLGPIGSMDRSAQLTKGNRWKIFGLLLLTALPAVVIGWLIDFVASVTGAGGILSAGCHVILDGTWGAVSAALVVAAYHDLRVAKEGVETVQVAAVFE